jgi:hypothetical protein
VIDAGNASAHRGYRPDNEHMKTMVDILEAIFLKVPVAPRRKQDLAAKAKRLQETIPKRKPINAASNFKNLQTLAILYFLPYGAYTGPL